jgi:hypothetical protein
MSVPEPALSSDVPVMGAHGPRAEGVLSAREAASRGDDVLLTVPGSAEVRSAAFRPRARRVAAWLPRAIHGVPASGPMPGSVGARAAYRRLPSLYTDMGET